MKSAKKLVFALGAFFLLTGSIQAQDWLEDPKWGNSPEERTENVKLWTMLSQANNMKNFDNVLNYGRKMIETAPKAMQNLYVFMGNAYLTKINQATSKPEKNAYVDSLMWIHDMRVEAYGDDATYGRAYTLPRKASDYLSFRPDDRETVYRYFLEAIEVTGGKAPNVVNTYFNVLVEDYKLDDIETDKLLEEYEKLAALFESADTPEAQDGMKTLESLLIDSGAANCDNLEVIYKPRFEADPNNVELMQKIVTLMSRGNCENEFRLSVTENLYKVQPDPQTSVALAVIFQQRGDYEKSLFYFQESINNETDPTLKTTYTLNAAAMANAAKNYRQAADFARAVIAMDPENGLAYMVLGQAQASAIPSNCSDPFTRRTAYWIVVDNLQQARARLADSDMLTTVNQQISTFSQNFPNNDETFFSGISAGSAYTVNCGWISGRTTVRVR